MDWFMALTPPCVVKWLTGWPCPWCGMQRGIIALFEGNIWESMAIFPPLFPMLFLVLVLVLNMKFVFQYRLFLLYGTYALVLTALIFNFFIKILSL